MALTTRASKGSALTHAELDANFNGLADGSLITVAGGTWTPTLSFAVPGDLNVVYSERVGFYVKIGQLVTLNFSIFTSTFTFTTASGNLQVTTSPYSPSALANYSAVGACRFQGITKANYTSVNCRITSSTTIFFDISGSGQTSTQVQASDMPSGGTVLIKGTLSYLAAS